MCIWERGTSHHARIHRTRSTLRFFILSMFCVLISYIVCRRYRRRIRHSLSKINLQRGYIGYELCDEKLLEFLFSIEQIVCFDSVQVFYLFKVHCHLSFQTFRKIVLNSDAEKKENGTDFIHVLIFNLPKLKLLSGNGDRIFPYKPLTIPCVDWGHEYYFIECLESNQQLINDWYGEWRTAAKSDCVNVL